MFTSKLRTTGAQIIAMLSLALVLTVSTNIATPQKAEAFTAPGQPTIGCLAGVLELNGRAIWGTQYNEQVWSRFFLYRYDSAGRKWDRVETTQWVRFDMRPQTFSQNSASAVKRSGEYYMAYEQLAWQENGQWKYHTALTKLRPDYAAYGTHFGSSYYARCS